MTAIRLFLARLILPKSYKIARIAYGWSKKKPLQIVKEG